MFSGIVVTMVHCIMQVGGSGLAVFWRNQPIPEDDKDDFKEWKAICVYGIVMFIDMMLPCVWLKDINQDLC